MSVVIQIIELLDFLTQPATLIHPVTQDNIGTHLGQATARLAFAYRSVMDSKHTDWYID